MPSTHAFRFFADNPSRQTPETHREGSNPDQKIPGVRAPRQDYKDLSLGFAYSTRGAPIRAGLEIQGITAAEIRFAFIDRDHGLVVRGFATQAFHGASRELVFGFAGQFEPRADLVQVSRTR